VGVRSLQASLLNEFSVQVDAAAPDMFLLDVQKPQVEGVRAFLGDRSHGAGEFQLIPVMRGRVVGVAGRETTLDGVEDVRRSGMPLGRECPITSRDPPEGNEKIVEGRFWNSPSPELEVSGEQEIAPRARLHVGDTIRFDILGRVVAPKITSIR